MSKKPASNVPQIARLTIGSLDDSKLAVVAQYNPKELELARNVPWQKHNSDNTPEARRKTPAPGSDVEYTGAEGRTISLELLFDGLESNQSVVKQMLDLDELATPRDAASPKTDMKRPHQCVVVWGTYAELDKKNKRPEHEQALRPLRCVIESLTVKYTMFTPSGTPVRAIANVKLREASVKLPNDAEETRAKALAKLRYDRSDAKESR